MFRKCILFLFATLTFNCTEAVNTSPCDGILEWHLLCYRFVFCACNIINASFDFGLNCTSLCAPDVALLQPWIECNYFYVLHGDFDTSLNLDNTHCTMHCTALHTPCTFTPSPYAEVAMRSCFNLAVNSYKLLLEVFQGAIRNHRKVALYKFCSF